MRYFLYAIKGFSHPEEHPQGASRRTHHRNATISFGGMMTRTRNSLGLSEFIPGQAFSPDEGRNGNRHGSSRCPPAPHDARPGGNGGSNSAHTGANRPLVPSEGS